MYDSFAFLQVLSKEMNYFNTKENGTQFTQPSAYMKVITA